MKNFTVIAIDGGAGTGKSTTANLLSNQFNLLHVDTGSHYRAITAAFLDSDITPADAGKSQNLNKIELNSSISKMKSTITINGLTIPQGILRSDKINSIVSSYASIPSIRSLLFDYQKSQIELARSNQFSGLVMEGRDIGSIILPNADLKLFLTADETIRNERRELDGESDQISVRDHLDTTRKIAPLTRCIDSVLIDTTELTKDEVLSRISQLINNL
ncbi:MAG: (d)CMP kinase [Opitutales bacterium]|nr:(d)CMP kinase [Opitutales bacterium]